MGACSTIPLVALLFNSSEMVALMAGLSSVALLAEGARFLLPGANRVLMRWLKPLLRESERRRITGATYIALSSLVAFLLFDKPVAIAALFFLSLGDPLAALVGTHMGSMFGLRRFYGKSPVGTLAFLTVALTAAGVLSASGVVPFHWGLVAGAAIAAIVELVPLMVDDNVSIPLVSGAAMTLMGV